MKEYDDIDLTVARAIHPAGVCALGWCKDEKKRMMLKIASMPRSYHPLEEECLREIRNSNFNNAREVVYEIVHTTCGRKRTTYLCRADAIWWFTCGCNCAITKI